MQSGDRVFAYSDGVIEQKPPTGEMFGELRFETALAQIIQNNAPIGEMFLVIKDYSGGQDIADDITMIELLI
jgi:serine phosphatase RsbU (regulator of sigma subunit)